MRYAALLRAVNLGGRTSIAMADLRSLLGDLGLENVRTVLASGNAVFDSVASTDLGTADSSGPAALGTEIETALTDRLGLSTRVLLRTHEQLTAVLKANPYPTAEDEPSKHLVQFLFEPVAAADRAHIEAFDAPAFEPEQFHLGVEQQVIYFRFPDGMGRSPLSVAFGRHVGKGLVMTGRNWNTVRKLHELTGA